jgi:hypothetical protein
MTTRRPNWPAGPSSPQALQTATDALFNVGSTTMLHPVIIGQAIELACLLSAYGLLATDPHAAARTRSRSPNHDVLLDIAADPMN